MIYICYSELCVIKEDCECNSQCCRGVKTKPMIITYISDQEITTNNPLIEYEVSERAIYDLCIHHHCPFCGSYVEA
jgi:hypothetical protein